MDEGIRARLKRLRTFGLILGAIAAFVGWRWHVKGRALAPWLMAGGALSAALALARPQALEPLERRWMKVARLIGRANTYVVLTLLYYLVITPYSLLMRLFSKDPLDQLRDKKPSYWKRRTSGEDLSSYERQF